MTETKTRNKTAYHVLHEQEKGIWRQVTDEPEKEAKSRQDAILKASDNIENGHGGKFMAIAAKEIKPIDKPKAKGTSRTKELERELEELRAQLAA